MNKVATDYSHRLQPQIITDYHRLSQIDQKRLCNL